MKKEIPASAAILGLSQKRAAAILREARETAEALRQDAFESGYRAGLEEGRRMAEEVIRKRYQEALDEVQRASFAQEEGIRSWFVEATPDLVDIAVEVAAAVIRKQVETDREAVVAQTRAALEALGHVAWARLRVHPIDVPRVQVAYENRAGLRTQDLAIVADETVSPGGCVAEGPGASVDATLEGQIDNLRGLLKRAS